MGYAVLHMEKSSASDSGMSAHIERTVAPKNADADRTHLNREMITFPDGVQNRTQAIQHRLDTAGLQRKIGKNQVRAVRILLTGSPDDMKRIEQAGKLDEWCKDNLDWLHKTYGVDNIVSTVLHLDETTPHIHATMIPIVTGERRKKKSEEQAAGEKKKKYRKKDTSANRLCADDVMSRVKLKEYQNTYAETMAKYGLQRGIEGSEAKHITTSQYYRDLLNQTESIQSNISALLKQQEAAKTELSKVQADVSKEKLKNSAADVGSKLMDGVSFLLGTPKMNKIEAENKELRGALQNLYDENKQIKQSVEVVKSKALKEIENFGQQFQQREQGLLNENSMLKSTLNKIYNLFPYIEELLKFEKFCQKVGFGVEMIRKMFNREEVSFQGKIYSHEYDRKYHTNHSVAKVELNPKQPTKFRLNIDGLDIYDWFRQKQKEFLQNIGVNLSEQKNNKGLKL